MLSKYIHELLYRYECVIIPEFGGILTKTTSATIDPETHTFYPPSKRLGFNSQLVENDGLLAHHIASVDKVPYETALNFIKFEVTEWKTKLENQDLSLENIGTFSLNSEGKILFEPDPNSNFLTDSFGLQSLETHTVTRNGEMEEVHPFDTLSDTVAENEIAVNTAVRREIAPFYKYAAAIIILLAIIGAFAIQILDLNKKDLQVASLKKDNDAEINRIIQEATFEINSRLPDITIKVKNEDDIIDDNDSIIENNDMQNIVNTSRVQIKQDRINEILAKKKEETTTVEAQATQTKDVTKPKTDTNTKVETTPVNAITKTEKTAPTSDYNSSSNTNLKYHIIAGAFRDVANASKKVNQLKAKGYDAHIVGVNKWQLTQVAFSSFATKAAAQQALQSIKKKEAKDAWLLVK